MTLPLYGWDTSHYDAPDQRRALNEGFSFFTHKAGGDANDAELGVWWDYMKPYRGEALLGAYWVLYPGNPAGRADQFINRLDAVCDGWRDGPFLLQIDAEIWGGDKTTKPSVAECNTFADRLVTRMPKLRPVGYLPKWVYGSAVSSFRYPLWASAYVTGTGSASRLYPGDNSSRWAPYGGKTPAILQFSSSATIAGQATCDANAYRGTLADLIALAAPGWKEEIMTTVDLTPAAISAVAGAVADTVDAHGVLVEFFFGAFHASQNGGAGDAAYLAADALTQKAWRNARDILQGTVGAPVSQAAILAAVAAAPSVDATALAQALMPGLAAALTAALQSSMPTDKMTAEEIGAIAENALRNVLRTGVDGSGPSKLETSESADVPLYEQLTREQREQQQTRIAGTGQ